MLHQAQLAVVLLCTSLALPAWGQTEVKGGTAAADTSAGDGEAAASDPPGQHREAASAGAAKEEAGSQQKASPAPADETNAEAETEAPSYLRQPTPPAADKQAVATKAEPDLVRIILALGLVLALGAVALVAKRRREGNSPLKNQIRLHALGSLPLGPKSKVALLSVGREALLLGVTEQGVTCLRTYPENELWSLTASLPGFSDGTTQAKKATAPDKSLMERGVEGAFSELLNRAHRSDSFRAKGREATTAAAGARNGAPKEASEPADEFVPTDFARHQASQQRGGSARAEAPNAAEASSDLPPHLVALLRENSLDSTDPAPSTNVVPLHPQGDDVFGDPEGQAAELMRRFSEIRS